MGNEEVPIWRRRRRFLQMRAWKRLLEKYPIAETVEQKGVYKIKADRIQELPGAPAYGQMGQL